MSNLSHVYLNTKNACRDISKIKELKRTLSREFDMKDFGAAKKIIGMKIKRPGKWEVVFSQGKYISKVLVKFNMVNVKPMSTPLCVSLRFECKAKSVYQSRT